MEEPRQGPGGPPGGGPTHHPSTPPRPGPQRGPRGLERAVNTRRRGRAQTPSDVTLPHTPTPQHPHTQDQGTEGRGGEEDYRRNCGHPEVPVEASMLSSRQLGPGMRAHSLPQTPKSATAPFSPRAPGSGVGVWGGVTCDGCGVVSGSVVSLSSGGHCAPGPPGPRCGPGPRGGYRGGGSALPAVLLAPAWAPPPAGLGRLGRPATGED